MKLLLISTMLLIVMQAAPPVPRQAAKDRNAQKPQQVNGKANDANQSAQKQPPATENTATQATNGKTAENSQVTQERSVSVSKLPTVSVADSSYWSPSVLPVVIYDILTFLLLATGAVGVCFALRTLRAIERQTAAFVHSQRPIIACNPHTGSGPEWHPIFDLIANNRMSLDLFNRGQTNAFHCQSEMWIELVPHAANASFSDMEDFTFTDKAVYFAPKHPFRIYPNQGPVVMNIPAGRDLSPAEHAALKGARLLACVRLRVTYRDVFLSPNDPDRFSDFGFWVMFDGLGTLTNYQDSN